MAKTEFKTIAQNKKAYHDYFVEETLEAGIALCGTEVKSLRQGRCNLKDAWCSVVDGEMLLNGCHISPYEQGNIFNRDPMFAHAQARDHAAFWPFQNRRLFAHSAFRVL